MAEESRLVELTLPWPPSVNTYWRRNGNRYFISGKGQKYRKDVCLKAHGIEPKFSEHERLSVSISAYPPDKRRRDLDNILKSLLDSLQHAGVYFDDSQIDKLSIERNSPLSAKLIVKICPHNYQGTSSLLSTPRL